MGKDRADGRNRSVAFCHGTPTSDHGAHLSSRVQWRWFERARDAEAVAQLHAQMEQRIGTKLDLPVLDERPIIATVVGETDGVVSHCIFLEAEVEVCSASPNVLTAKDAQGAVEMLMPVLDMYRIRIARAFIPSLMLEAKGKRKSPLARTMDKLGFTRENASVSQFFRWLATKEQER